MENTEIEEINEIIKQLDKAELKGDTLQIAACCDQLAECYAQLDDEDMALALYQKSINVLQQAGAARRVELANAYYKQGVLLGNKYYRALPCFKKALDLFTIANDEEGCASCNYHIGRITLNKSNIGEDNSEEALPYFTTAVEMYSSFKDAESTAIALTYKGLCEINIDKLKEAEEDLEYAIEIAKHIDEPEILDDALYRLALAYYKGEKYFKGQKLLEQAIEINRKSKDYEDLSYMLQTYGEILCSLEKYEQAIEAFKESEQIKRCSGNMRNHLPDTIFWLGTTYFRMNKLPEALLYFQEEISLRNEAEVERLALAYGNLAYVCMKLGYTRDAIMNYFNKVKVYGDDDYYTVERAEAYYELAEAHASIDANATAVKIFKKAQEEFKMAVKAKITDDTEPIEKCAKRIAELDKGNMQEENELPEIDVPEILTDEYIADTIRAMVADTITSCNESEKRKSIGFLQNGNPNIDDDATFESLGADEITVIEICINAETLFDIEIPDEVSDEITTTAELIAAVKKCIEEQQ